jgi:hypothetical protein
MQPINVTLGTTPFLLELKVPIAPCESRVVKFRVCFEYEGNNPDTCFNPYISALTFESSGGCLAVLNPIVYPVLAGVPSTDISANSTALHISPNPASGTLRLDLSQPMRISTVRLLNLDGHEVLRKSLEQGEDRSTMEFNIATIASGQYIVVVEGDDRVLQQAVTITH